MPLLPRRFERLQAVLNRRMGDLTVVLEAVDKPHNLSAILRTCDAVGVLEAHVVSLPGRPRTFNKTAKGSQKWVPLLPHPSIEECLGGLKQRGFRIYGTHLSVDARDYRDCDFTGPSCFLMGAEKWGMSPEALAMVDQPLFIPMTGMVQSLNVSVAAATLTLSAVLTRRLECPDGVPLTDLSQSPLPFETVLPTLHSAVGHGRHQFCSRFFERAAAHTRQPSLWTRPVSPHFRAAVRPQPAQLHRTAHN